MNGTRTALSLLLATLLLQALPALSVCACDVPMASDCCSAPEPQPEKTSSCCSEATVADQATFSPPGCKRAVVSLDLPSVTLPSTPETRPIDQPLPAMDRALAPIAPPTADVAALDRSRGSPPLPSAPRLFLLDAALLI